MKADSKKTDGLDWIERHFNDTLRIPGIGPATSPTAYTSETEIRERVAKIVQMPPKKLSDRQAALADNAEPEDSLTSLFKRSRVPSLEERERIAAQWIERLLESTKRRGRLMTDIQLADWRIGRKLGTGDRAKYIGPDRVEKTESGLFVLRPHGQTGTIINVFIDSQKNRFITFHPDKAVQPEDAPKADKQYVELQVREHTPGWLHLERLV